jgi:hypothetical protein
MSDLVRRHSGIVSSQIDQEAQETRHSETASSPPYDHLRTPDTIEKVISKKLEEEDDTHLQKIVLGKQTTQSGHEEEDEQGEVGEEQADVNDLMHGVNSFWAIVFPVATTMVISSIVVVNYRSANIEASMSTYLVYQESSTQSSGEVFGSSLVNALVIIGGIAVLTFGMALLYKFNCMKFLVGYIMFASTAILSFVGGQLVDSIINDQLQWICDWPSFLFVMTNFGVVGVISIFYQKVRSSPPQLSDTSFTS